MGIFGSNTVPVISIVTAGVLVIKKKIKKKEKEKKKKRIQ